MKELTTWFEVMDSFGGDESIIDMFYEDALKIAEANGYTFSRELFYQTTQIMANP